MRLKEYLEKNKLSAIEFARKCQCGATTINKIVLENKCSENIALLIHFSTNGEVSTNDLKVLPNMPVKKNRWAHSN